MAVTSSVLDAPSIVDTLGYRPFDADNHYYEATDCVARHLDPKHATRVSSGPRSTGGPTRSSATRCSGASRTPPSTRWPHRACWPTTSVATPGDKFFHRFPNLRVASVENGSEYLAGLFDRLRVVAGKMAAGSPEDPVETFRRHIWIDPFWEDHVDDVLAGMGPDRVIFGSDWPQVEALPEPLQYVAEVSHLGEDDQRKILRDNVLELNEHRPA